MGKTLVRWRESNKKKYTEERDKKKVKKIEKEEMLTSDKKK